MTTPERIKRLFELDGKRTQGEWVLAMGSNGFVYTDQASDWLFSKSGDAIIETFTGDYDREPYVSFSDSDAHFIAAAPEAVSIVKELLGVIEKQRETLEYARKRIDYLSAVSPDERHFKQDEKYSFPRIDEALQLSAPYVNLNKGNI